MKKIFTLTILSLMLALTILNSCSKSSDSSTTPTPTPTPVVKVGVDTIIIDGGLPIELARVYCGLGAAGIFTMTFADPASNLVYLTATFSAQPTTARNYNIVFSPPSLTTDVQLQLTQTGLTGSYYVSQNQKSDSATLTLPNGNLQLSFSNIHFVKSAKTDKVVSSTILCN